MIDLDQGKNKLKTVFYRFKSFKLKKTPYNARVLFHLHFTLTYIVVGKMRYCWYGLWPYSNSSFIFTR